jgi:formylglycine-generating enzyme required for sulfatase activity
VLCTNGADEVVKVGTKRSAFWIDRYEASVWTADDGPTSGTQKFGAGDDSTINFPKNGQVLVPLYALSVANVTPSRFITWFQANEACAASGKRLPLGDEWLRAARGTTDPPADNDGTMAGNTKCNTKGMGPGLRATGKGIGVTSTTSCVSDWGAQDMIGNLWELTAEWYAGPGSSVGTSNWSDAAYQGDGTWNMNMVGSLPAAALRGGDWVDGPLVGAFALFLGSAPSGWDHTVGFRCVVPR